MGGIGTLQPPQVPDPQILRVVMGPRTPSVSKGMGGIGALQPPHHVKEMVHGEVEGEMELNRNRERGRLTGRVASLYPYVYISLNINLKDAVNYVRKNLKLPSKHGCENCDGSFEK